MRPLVAKMTVLGFLGAESLGGASARFGGFFFTVLGRRGGLKRTEQPVGDGGNFVYGCLERLLIGLGRLVEAGDLSYKLQRCGMHFFIGNWRIKVEKRLDVSAHL